MVRITGGMKAALRAENIISKWDQGLEFYINHDWQNAQKQPFPERNLAWNAHDSDTREVVNAYNDYLSGTPCYQSLDWHLIKAILFVETGAHNEDWASRPMQSDNRGDVGLNFMNTQSAREALIVPPALRSSLNNANGSSFNNIAAGVAYMLFRAAQFRRKDGGWVISGWDSIDPGSIAATYNANGRGTYGAELDFAYDMIKREKYLQ